MPAKPARRKAVLTATDAEYFSDQIPSFLKWLRPLKNSVVDAYLMSAVSNSVFYPPQRLAEAVLILWSMDCVVLAWIRR